MDMQLISSQNKGFKYLLAVIDIFSKYAWIIPLRTKTAKEIIDSFSLIFKTRKPNKIWTDAGKEFINKYFKKYLSDNNVEIYQTYNEGKAVVVERFNRTFKEKIWRYFTEYKTKTYINVLADLVSEYNNTVHSTTKLTPVDASKPENEYLIVYRNPVITQKPKFKVGDRVRIYKYKKHFEKSYESNWSKEIFVVSAIIFTAPITYKIKDLNDEEIIGSFYKNELTKTLL